MINIFYNNLLFKGLFCLKRTTRQKKSNKAVNLGLFSNILLSILKTVFGIIGFSSALTADGINSVSDVIYYVVVKIFIKLSSKPPDEEHPYGHTQLETIAAIIVGSFIITTALAIFWNSISAVFDLLTGNSDFTGPHFIALWVALLTVLIKIILTLWTFKLGKVTNNAAVLALAQDHRNDILAASAAVLGILLGKLGMIWVDPLAGAFVSVIIFQTGIVIIRESSEDLMDAVPGKALCNKIEEVLSPIDEVIIIEELHAHRFGPYFVINITIGIEETLNIKEGDSIATRVEDIIMEKLDYIRKVYVHYHPANFQKNKKGIGIICE